MPRILLKFHDKVLKKLEMTKPMVTIGRKADNDVVIDNLSVSGHHAQIVEEDGAFFILDKDSTNGTYLNDKKIVRLQLQNGDEVRIGKHTVVFQDDGAGKSAPMQPAAESKVREPEMRDKPTLGADGQVSLEFDKAQHQEDEGKATVATMTATKEAPKLTLKEAPQEIPEKVTMEVPKTTSTLAFKESTKEVPQEASEEVTLEAPKAPLKETPQKAPAAAVQEDALVEEEELLPVVQEVTRTKKERSAPSTSQVATLTTISGPTDKSEYQLTAPVTIIGSQDNATVKITKWFGPKVAALITRRGAQYSLSKTDGGKPILQNGVPVEGRSELKDGDLLEVAGAKMYFHFNDPTD